MSQVLTSAAEVRQQVLAKARRVVIKLGTQILAGPKSAEPTARRGLDVAFIQDMADQIVTLRQRGVEVTMVCSGAIGAGCMALNLAKRPTDVAELQAVAAVGQRQLMTHWHDAFGKHHIEVGQLLLTRGDFDDRVRFLNIRNCISRLHELGCIPIINENDTVAVEELRFGDNDMLAALITNALRAEALALLTVVEGLLDGDGRRIEMIDDFGRATSVARTEKSSLGTGGIHTKLDSARLVTGAGEVAIIAPGRRPNVLLDLFSGADVGTVFIPAAKKLDSRSRWIGMTKRPAGTVTVDEGAATALRKGGKSLLAIGITQATGTFEAGDVLLVQAADGTQIARGLSNYDSGELQLIVGKKSSQFEKILGRPAFAEVIHRDHLVLL